MASPKVTRPLTVPGLLRGSTTSQQLPTEDYIYNKQDIKGQSPWQQYLLCKSLSTYPCLSLFLSHPDTVPNRFGFAATVPHSFVSLSTSNQIQDQQLCFCFVPLFTLTFCCRLHFHAALVLRSRLDRDIWSMASHQSRTEFIISDLYLLTNYILTEKHSY